VTETPWRPHVTQSGLYLFRFSGELLLLVEEVGGIDVGWKWSVRDVDAIKATGAGYRSPKAACAAADKEVASWTTIR
jgi:hypothetical protein